MSDAEKAARLRQEGEGEGDGQEPVGGMLGSPEDVLKDEALSVRNKAWHDKVAGTDCDLEERYGEGGSVYAEPLDEILVGLPSEVIMREHLQKYRFKRAQGLKMHNGNKSKRVSIVKALNYLFTRQPQLQAEVAQRMIDLALGNADKDTAHSSVQAIKALLDRTDGPVIKKVDANVRADRTVIAHDGPAIQSDLIPASDIIPELEKG